MTARKRRTHGRAGEGHPTRQELERFARWDIDPEADVALTDHIKGCARCRAAVEADRHAFALLTLPSTPPANLFERVQERRAHGPRPLTPTVAPHVGAAELRRYAAGDADEGTATFVELHLAECEACRQALADLRHVQALLTLRSAPPPDLFERARARYRAGVRVILPRPGERIGPEEPGVATASARSSLVEDGIDATTADTADVPSPADPPRGPGPETAGPGAGEEADGEPGGRA